MKKIIILILLLIPLCLATSSWPGSTTYTNIGSGLSSTYEVSGLYYNQITNKIYSVSDSGIVSSLNTDGTQVQSWWYSADLEGITFADESSNYVYLGIENPDKIVEFDLTTGTATGRYWDLTPWMRSSNDNSGLEALTFIPNEDQNYYTGRSGGLFLAGLQETGIIYVFDIDTSTTNAVSLITSLTPLARTDVSDAFYDRNSETLFFIYDSGNVIYEVKTNGSVIGEFSLPGNDQEGIALKSNCYASSTAEIFIGQDTNNSILKYNSFPVVCSWHDTDDDGLEDYEETEIYNTDPENVDMDGDSLNDYDEVIVYGTDPNNVDSDGDGLSDYEEINYNTDPNDFDSDNDGLNDFEEINTYSTDPNDNDSDDDELTDSEEVEIYFTSPVDADSDGDGLSDYEEIMTCGTNPNNIDSDGDSLNDYDEVIVYETNPNNTDTDNDRLSDYDEINSFNTNPNNPDSDNDLLSDYEEIMSYYTDPNDLDDDNDGLNDFEEVRIYLTNPNNIDSDGDRLSDYDEVNVYHTNPNNTDSEGDGLNDYDEVRLYGTNPMNPDTDMGGIVDYEEIFIKHTNPNDSTDDSRQIKIIANVINISRPIKIIIKAP